MVKQSSKMRINASRGQPGGSLQTSNASQSAPYLPMTGPPSCSTLIHVCSVRKVKLHSTSLSPKASLTSGQRTPHLPSKLARSPTCKRNAPRTCQMLCSLMLIKGKLKCDSEKDEDAQVKAISGHCRAT